MGRTKAAQAWLPEPSRATGHYCSLPGSTAPGGTVKGHGPSRPEGSGNGEEEQTPEVHGGEAMGPLMGVEGSKVVYYLGRE